MKYAKKIFAILFFVGYLFYAGDAFFHGAPSVFGTVLSVFPNQTEMSVQGGTAAFSFLASRTRFLEEHAQLQIFMEKTESGGMDVIAVGDDTFISANDGQWGSWDIEGFAISLYRLKDAMETQGLETQVLFLSSQPQTVDEQADAFEGYPLPEQAQMMETMLYYLHGYRVDFMDTHLALQKTTLSSTKYLFKTDTKWTIQASFLVASAFAERLSGQWGADRMPIDGHYDTENFVITTEEDGFLGTLGMRAGEAFTGREDFTVLVPGYETNLTYSTFGEQETSVTGTFEQTLINWEHLEPLDPYTYSAYSVFMDGGAHYHRVIENHLQPDGPKVLLIHDSMALPFAAYAALTVGELHMYWPDQAPAGDSFRVLSYVMEHDIDYVVFLSECNYYALSNLFEVNLQ